MPLPRLPTLRALLRRAPPTRTPARIHAFTSTPHALAKPLPPRRIIPDAELVEKFLKGSGPGGQKINKTSSAVQLIHLPTGIVVKYQDTRSRSLNRKMARKILGDRIEELEKGEGARTRVKARQKGKKKASADKKKRRKYRGLSEGKEGVGGEDGEDGGLEDEGEGEAEAVGESVLDTEKVGVERGVNGQLREDERPAAGAGKAG